MSKATSTSVRPGIALRDPGHLLSLGLGAGLMPRAPGTWGSLLAVPIYLVLYPYGQAVYIIVVAVMFGAGIYLTGRTAKALGVHDHPAIVIDEVAGMMVTWLGAPPSWPVVLIGFVLFRLFDILKPWPIRRIDEGLGGGTGIMVDDLLAGLMAAAVLQLLLYWPPLATVVAGAH